MYPFILFCINSRMCQMSRNLFFTLNLYLYFWSVYLPLSISFLVIDQFQNLTGTTDVTVWPLLYIKTYEYFISGKDDTKKNQNHLVIPFTFPPPLFTIFHCPPSPHSSHSTTHSKTNPQPQLHLLFHQQPPHPSIHIPASPFLSPPLLPLSTLLPLHSTPNPQPPIHPSTLPSTFPPPQSSFYHPCLHLSSSSHYPSDSLSKGPVSFWSKILISCL